MKTIYFDGQKGVRLENLPPEAWTVVTGGETETNAQKLFGIVAWLYRAVEKRAGGVASMPFEIRQGQETVYEFDGITPQDAPPRGLAWVDDLPFLLANIEAAAVLCGKAYLEKRGNLLGSGTAQLDWLLPWSITPKFADNGELLRFERQTKRGPIGLEVEDVVYFWPPDYSVERGPAKNYPARAVAQNAGVIHSLDLFLKGYFDRGLVKAQILKYQNQISAEESKRVKEWWKRVFMGVRNAFSTEVVRGDFDIMTIGEGIADLRDDVLTKAEKESIAIGLGVPLSKMDSSVATDSNRDADDRQFIEETTIPSINWQYRVLNRQVLNPLGYSIIAKPQLLRVMQADENNRSIAFRNYVGSGVAPGYTVEEAEAILGIYVPEDVRATVQERAREHLGQQGTAVEPLRAVDLVAALDKRDERDRLIRWAKNKEFKAIRVDDFESDVLTTAEKTEIIYSAIRKNQKALAVDGLIDDYGDRLARYVKGNLKKSQDDFLEGFRKTVESGLMEIFSRAVGAEELNSAEMNQFTNLLQFQIEASEGYVGELYKRKGIAFDETRESLQALGGNLGGRLQLWKNAARQFWNRGLIIGRREETMTWRLGGTEKSCNDCLFYNGQTKNKDEWSTLAGVLIYPQSRALACNGYNCDCVLVLD